MRYPGSAYRSMRFHIAIALAGAIALSLTLGPTAWACIGRDGSIPSFGGSGANPGMAEKIAASYRAARDAGLKAPPQPPISGTHPLVIILIENAAAGAPFAYPTASLWSSRISEIANYYTEVSRGVFTVTPATESYGTANDGVIGPVTVSSLNSATDGGTISLAVQAVRAANPYINFATYDTDNSGTIEADELHIVIYQAGNETSFDASASTPRAWAHMQWQTPRLSGLIPASDSDSKNITSYCYGGSSFDGLQRVTMGTMTHELGHDIGLPDLYDVDEEGSGGDWGGLGRYSLMSSGSWGGDYGETPTHIDGFLKSWLGWASVTDVTAPANQAFSLATANGSNAIVRVESSTASNEFFVIENREKTGYDAGLGGSLGGLIVYHCDGAILTDSNIRLYNSINMNPSNPGISVEQADGLDSLHGSSSWGSDGDFFRAGNSTVFNASSTPNSNLKSGAASGVNMSAVSAYGSTMTFKLGTVSDTPTFTFAPASYTALESAGSATVTVHLSAEPGATARTVQYATTAAGTAEAGSDFTAVSGTLTFTGTETSKTLTVPILDDGVIEATETIYLTLSSPTNADLGSPSTAIIVVLDEDVDTDGDGINDYDETHGTRGYVTDPTLKDTDHDGINDLDEINGTLGWATNPTLWDTDGDGFSDSLEASLKFNPTDGNDYPLSLGEFATPFFH